MTSKEDWELFCNQAASVMRDALQNKITLSEASAFFENDKTMSDPNLRRYVESMVWEIDGSPGYYKELVELFASRATEEELKRWLNS